MSDHTRTHDSDPLPDPSRTRTASDSNVPFREPSLPSVAPPGYELLGELGRGGIGIVYKARQTRLNRIVALKMLRGADLSSAAEHARFLAEAEAVAAVRHPHVVQVFEVGDHNGLPFLALEYLEGGTLSQRLKRDPASGARLAPRAAAELVVKLAAAVQAIHDQGIVHRDLKPSNVLFDEAGLPKVADFGLAKRGTSDLTKTQAVMGTPAYMSPEQAKGETKFVGPTADVWALGAILYECLTGTSPFDADDTWLVLQNVIHRDPTLPRKLIADVPRDLELITMKCLSKEPHRRYPTAAALADDLNRFLAGQPVSVRPAGPGERMLKWGRRNPAVAGLVGALAVAIIIGFAGITWALLRAEAHSRDLARANDEITDAFNALKRSEDALSDSVAKLKQSQVSLTHAEREASVRAEEAESREYLADISLANQLWRANDVRGMREVLDRCPAERRKWEWQYLHNLTRPLLEVIPTESIPVSIAYSPDGSLLAYQMVDGTLVVRDTKAKRERFRIPGHRGPHQPVAPVFQPTGSELACVLGESVCVVDPETGRVHVLQPASVSLPGAANARIVALGYTSDGTLRLLRKSSQGYPEKVFVTVTEVGRESPHASVLAYEEPPGVSLMMSTASFNRDASRFAIMVADTGIRSSSTFERVDSEQPDKDKPELDPKPKPKPKPPPMRDLGPVKPRLLVFDAQTGNPIGTGEGTNSRLASIAFKPTQGVVAFGRSGQAIEVIPNAAEFTRPGHNGQVNAVAYDHDRRLWSGCDGGLVIGHPYRENQLPIILRGCPFPVLRLAAAANGTEVAAATGHLTGAGGAICRFDVRNAERDRWRAPANTKRISFITGFAPDGRFAAVDIQSEPEKPAVGTIRLQLLDPLRNTEYESTPRQTSLRAVFLPSGQCVTVDSLGLRRYSAEADLLKHIPFKGPHVDGLQQGLLALPDGRSVIHVLPGLFSRNPKENVQAELPAFALRIQTVDVETGVIGTAGAFDLRSHVPPEADIALVIPYGCGMDATGRIAAFAATVYSRKNESDSLQSFGVVIAWDVASGKELFRHIGADGQMHAVAFDPAGRLFAGGESSSGGKVIGWNLTTKAEVFSLRAHTRSVMALAFGPDGRLATGGSDGQVKLWDVASKWEVLTLDNFPREVGYLTFTPEGHLVAGTGVDILAMLMANGPPGDWVPAEVRVYRTTP